MDEGYKILIAAGLVCCCVGLFLFEMIKRLEVSVTIDKLVALGIGLIYLVFACFDGPKAIGGMAMFLLPTLGLIWFAEEFGEMTGMSIRGGTINKTSPAFLVRLFGWLFLLAPVALGIWFAVASPV